MGENATYEALRQRVKDLEEKLTRYEQGETARHLHELTKRLEKIAEMGDDGIVVFDEEYRI